MTGILRKWKVSILLTSVSLQVPRVISDRFWSTRSRSRSRCPLLPRTRCRLLCLARFILANLPPRSLLLSVADRVVQTNLALGAVLLETARSRLWFSCLNAPRRRSVSMGLLPLASCAMLSVSVSLCLLFVFLRCLDSSDIHAVHVLCERRSRATTHPS